MSLGADRTLEDRIIATLKSLGEGRAIDVAWYMGEEKRLLKTKDDTASACEVGLQMMAMEREGTLRYEDGKYAIPQVKEVEV